MAVEKNQDHSVIDRHRNLQSSAILLSQKYIILHRLMMGDLDD
jgi:hypothetical protein